MRSASDVSSVPWYAASSASYSVYGTAAPRPTTMERASTLLVSLVSATWFVASAVAVSVAPPLAAVQLPPMATLTVEPAGIAGVVPLRVVEPTVSRVTVPALTALVPRVVYGHGEADRRADGRVGRAGGDGADLQVGAGALADHQRGGGGAAVVGVVLTR
ncbi:hypothetical protein SMICM17S_07499 [Streptomyces microflavus]